MVKVSVIVPVYNVENYLEKCLSSLVNQTLKDIEIIIVNDGSPDNSQSIIDKYKKKYNNIKSFIKENGGLSDARNYGIKRASGEYISFVDSDDYVDITFLEQLYNKAKNEDLDIVLCDNIEVYPDGREVYINSNLNYSSDVIKNYLLAPPMACVRLYKRYLFDNEQFKKEILYEDLELTPGFVKQTKKIGFVSLGLYYYVQRSGSIMKQKHFNERLLDIFGVLEINKRKLYNDYPLEVEYMYITHLLRTATLRFLDYKNTKDYLIKINEIFKKSYPKWRKNIYFRKSSFKLKIICILSYYKLYGILKLIKKITNR